MEGAVDSLVLHAVSCAAPNGGYLTDTSEHETKFPAFSSVPGCHRRLVSNSKRNYSLELLIFYYLSRYSRRIQQHESA